MTRRRQEGRSSHVGGDRGRLIEGERLFNEHTASADIQRIARFLDSPVQAAADQQLRGALVALCDEIFAKADQTELSREDEAMVHFLEKKLELFFTSGNFKRLFEKDSLGKIDHEFIGSWCFLINRLWKVKRGMREGESRMHDHILTVVRSLTDASDRDSMRAQLATVRALQREQTLLPFWKTCLIAADLQARGRSVPKFEAGESEHTCLYNFITGELAVEGRDKNVVVSNHEAARTFHANPVTIDFIQRNMSSVDSAVTRRNSGVARGGAMGTAGEGSRREKNGREAFRTPMDERRAEVVELLQRRDNAVVVGETGSGKTTRIPEFLLEAFPGAEIAITQPRRVAVRSVAKYVASRRGSDVGGEVGYQVRFEDIKTLGTRANFMTDGILLRKLSFDPLLTEYDIVMVDEAHERSLDIDFVLGLLKRAQVEREKRGMSQLKIVVTSATIEKEKFAHYFGQAPVIEVPGRMYPVEVKYEREPVRDYARAAAQRVEQIVNAGQPGDVLIFMPGEREIDQTMAQIKSLNLPGIEVMPLLGSMDSEDQDKIFAKNSKRKVIVATNIAETSITIDGVCFVIDSGLMKQKEFNPATGIEALVVRGHARSGCEQRKGRAGRTAPGTCYRLYTEQEYNERQPFQTPEINRSNLDHVILAMKKIGIEDVGSFEFIDPPAKEAIDRAIKTLKMLGALDDDERLTHMGETMAEIPLSPELARMVIEAGKYGCTGSITTIAAMLGGKSIFVRPKEKEGEAGQAHAGFKRDGSDFLTMLEVWKQWSASGFSDQWARDRYLNVRQLFEVKEVRAQLMRELKRSGITVEDRNATPENIQKSVAAGLIQHLLVASTRFSYDRVVNGGGESIMIHPSSAAFEKRPRYMIGFDVVTTSKTFARKCQPIIPDWLPDIAPQLLEESNVTAAYDPDRDVVEETVGYALKRRSYTTVVERRRAVMDEARVREVFIKALIDGRVSLPAVAHNKLVIEDLGLLKIRSGGLVTPPDIQAFYEGRLGKVRSRREAVGINERLQFDVNEYCSPAMRAEIDQKYPEAIEINGHRLRISYEYQPANPDGYYESDRVETFKATITIPRDLILRLQAADIPLIGEGGRPEVIYSYEDYYYSRFDASLEGLQAQFDKQRLENEWSNFDKPERQIVRVGALEDLPDPSSLGKLPLAYALDSAGREILAYPGYVLEQDYDNTQRCYVKSYYLDYYQTLELATEETDKVVKQRAEEIAEKRRELDRETLMQPARAQYERIKSAVTEAVEDPGRHGFASDEALLFQQQWWKIGSMINGSDADPRQAIEIMTAMEQELPIRASERDRRLEMVAAVQAEFYIVQGKLNPITYENYESLGLTREQYDAIQTKWREAESALKVVGRKRKVLTPDPEKARRLLREIEAMIEVRVEFTPEQQQLVDIIMDRKGYAKFIRVSDGRVTEYAQPNRLSEVTDLSAGSGRIPIGTSGRELKVEGNSLTLVFGGGKSADASYYLEDGSYVVSRDAETVFAVEEGQAGFPHGLKAVSIVTPGERVLRQPRWRYVTTAGETSSQSKKPAVPVVAPPAVTSDEEIKRALVSLQGRMGGLGQQLGGGERFSAGGSKASSTPPVPEVLLPVEREKITPEARVKFTDVLTYTRLLLDTVRAVSEPDDKKAKNADKISKTRQQAKDVKGDLNALVRDIESMTYVDVARNKVDELAKRAERVAKEMARLQGEREDWMGRFQQFYLRMQEIAVAQEVEIDDGLRDKMRPGIVELAKRRGEIENLDGKLEEILFDLM